MGCFCCVKHGGAGRAVTPYHHHLFYCIYYVDDRVLFGPESWLLLIKAMQRLVRKKLKLRTFIILNPRMRHLLWEMRFAEKMWTISRELIETAQIRYLKPFDADLNHQEN